MPHLTDAKVLIVEDDWLQATELASHISGLGAEVIGPATSLEAALRLVERADMAVLDIDLNGVPVFPVADRLSERGASIVFYTGHAEMRVPERFRFASRLQKPSTGPQITSVVQSTLDLGSPYSGDVVGMIPGLRLTARLLLDDVQAADRLVERALRRAIATDQPEAEPRAAWLNRLVREIAEEQGRSILH